MKKAEKRSERRSQRDYSLAFKLQVVRQVEKGELTYKKAQRHYGIQGKKYSIGLVKKTWYLRLDATQTIYRGKRQRTYTRAAYQTVGSSLKR
jgi:hypothetical protein